LNERIQAELEERRKIINKHTKYLFYEIEIVLFVISFMVIALFANCKAEESKSEKALQEALKGKFLIGVAMNADQITGKDTAGVRLIKQHFNSITPENCMKSEVLQPEEGKFDFALADQYVDLAKNK